ncbi:MAG TPA: cytochrome c biogenesis protein CcsA [Thermoanaerobaculia bacterium]|nr:cytochrome c biogenesis protein CcsA [Thermoanaerobaculia bacterium]
MTRPLDLFVSAAVVLLPLAYLLAAAAYGRVFFAGDRRAERWATGLLYGALGLHVLDLAALVVKVRHFPAATVAEGLSVVALAVGITYALVEWRARERSTGFWIVSVVFFVQLLASVLQRPEPPHQSEVLKSAVFASHAFLALVAYAAFVMAAAYGFLFLELYRELKSGRFTLFYGKLPPLEALERMMAGALHVGWIALTGAVSIGAVWAYRLYGQEWAKDPIILLTLATWSLYGLALLLRRTQQWQGRQTAVVCLAGLCAILVSLVVVNFVVGDFHGFPGAT